MRAEFSVHVDPAELEAQRLAAVVEPAHDGERDAGKAGQRSAKDTSRESGARKAGRPQVLRQPRKYAFRRS